LIESWKQSVLVAVVVIAAIAAGAALQAWSLDHSPAVTDGGASVATMPCPVAQDICDLAARVEKDLQVGDYRKITSIVDSQVTLRIATQAILANGKPRLVSIGCPFGATSSTCDQSFALVFTTLQPQDDWTGTKGILILRYDRRPTGMTMTSTLADINGLVQRDARRVALAGGLAPSPCNLTGIAPDQSALTCSRSEFLPFGTQGPFIPAEVAVQQPFTLLSPVPPPPDSLLYVATGCWACEGFDTGIERVITDADGFVSLELVADPPLLPNEFVTGYGATPDGSQLLASTCQSTSCSTIGPGDANAHSRVFVSRDGGFSWQELASYPGYLSIRQVTADGRILISRNYGPGDPSTWPITWEVLPGQAQLVPPADAPSPNPVLAGDRVLWVSPHPGGGVSGLKLPLTAGDGLIGVFPLADGGTVFTWSRGGSGKPGGGNPSLFAGLLSPSGDLKWTREVPFTGQFAVAGELTGALLFGNVPSPDPSTPSGQLPALIDLDTAAIQPLGLPFGQKPLVGRNRFLAAVPGPFVRVSRPGNCADVRQSPANAAKSLGCFKDGVFLQDLGDVTTADGTAWVHVITPANDEGWVDYRFLAQ
jgi:hypothetical protein